MEEIKTVQFMLIRPNASYGAGAYTSPIDGSYKFVSMSKDKDGNEIPYRFIFRNTSRSLYIPENQVDFKDRSVVEFLRNHPECEGSKTNKLTGQIAYFKEIDVEKDADAHLEADRHLIKAKNLAIDLTGEKLRYVAALCGEFSDKPTLQIVAALRYAESAPIDFVKMVESPDVEARALLRSAVKAGVVKRKGPIHSFESVLLGSDEDEAVAKLQKESDLLKAIKKNLGLLKGVAK